MLRKPQLSKYASSIDSHNKMWAVEKVKGHSNVRTLKLFLSNIAAEKIQQQQHTKSNAKPLPS